MSRRLAAISPSRVTFMHPRTGTQRFYHASTGRQSDNRFERNLTVFFYGERTSVFSSPFHSISHYFNPLIFSRNNSKIDHRITYSTRVFASVMWMFSMAASSMSSESCKSLFASYSVGTFEMFYGTLKLLIHS